MEIKFNDPSLFVGLSGLRMQEDTQVLKKVLPPQFAWEAKIASALSSATTATTATMVGNVAGNLVMSTSLNFLWGMINTQQLIVLLPCFDVIMPANA